MPWNSGGSRDKVHTFDIEEQDWLAAEKQKGGVEEGGKVMDDSGLYDRMDSGSVHNSEEDGLCKWIGVEGGAGEVWTKDENKYKFSGSSLIIILTPK